MFVLLILYSDANRGGRQPPASKFAQDSADSTPEATTPKLNRNKNASKWVSISKMFNVVNLW